MRLATSMISAALAFYAIAPVARAAPELADVAGHYRIEASSTIAFSVAQVGGGGIVGDFRSFSGWFDLDPRHVAGSSVAFRLKPASVVAAQPRIEDFLRSSAVFDAANYPVITFRSTRVVPIDGESARIDGILSARGKSREESFTATLMKHRGSKVTFHVVGKVLRSPYGMDVGTPIYSNVVLFDMTLHGSRS
ncbi:MAG: YceI family protein [Pararhizobium sp.]